MSEGRQMLTAEQALACMEWDGDSVHNFINPAGGMLVGADHERASVEERLSRATTIEIGGEQCRAMKHGIAVTCDGRHYFYAADNDKLDALGIKPEPAHD